MECFDLYTLDGETSDEEYIQDEEAAKADSDACSDLDEDDDKAEKAERLEADPSTNQEPDNHSDNDGDIDSDDNDDITENVVSQSCKRSTTGGRRVLDSDSEDESGTESTLNLQRNDSVSKPDSSSEHLCASSTVSENTVFSAVLFEDTRDCAETTLASRTVETKCHPLKGDSRRKSSTFDDSEEASMPPLLLNDSVESDDSDGSFSATKPESDGELNANYTTSATDKEFGLQCEPPTQPVDEEGEEEERAVGGGEQDSSSLELSLLWQPSMPPPAQVRKDSSEEPTKVCKIVDHYPSIIRH